MDTAAKPRIVIFGAGNIGRSFIAPVFTAGGYEAVFADVAPAVLKALEERNSYNLVEKSDAGETCRKIEPVKGVNAADFEAVKAVLDGASICATCVGAAALPIVLRTIAAAAVDRINTLDLILAENLKGAGEMARQSFVDAGITEVEIDQRLGVIETSIGKMVPIMPSETAEADPLLSWAEQFNTLIVDADGFVGPIPEIPDLLAVSPIAPWVARKLYIHNFGHAAAAYIGYRAHPDALYIWEVLEDREVLTAVRNAMLLSGEALRLSFPGCFSADEIMSHVDDLLSRFRNRALGDTIYRVGRDLARKLARKDRVVGALAQALERNMAIGPMLRVFECALFFKAAGPDGAADKDDLRVLEQASEPDSFLTNIVGISANEEKELWNRLRTVMINHNFV